MVNFGLPPRSNLSYRLFMQFTEHLRRQHQLAEVRASKNCRLPNEKVVDIVTRPEVELHLRRKPVEPILVGLGQGAAGPEDPVRQPWNVCFGLLNSILDVNSPCRAEPAVRREF